MMMMMIEAVDVVRQSAAWGENKKCHPYLILSGYSSKISTFFIILHVVTMVHHGCNVVV